MLKVRLISYVQLLWGSGFAGFNVAFAAFWLLCLPELLLLALNSGTAGFGNVNASTATAGFHWQEILDAVAILAVYGLIYAALFHLAFFVIRTMAAVLSHGQALLARIAPGIAVFVLLGEPLYKFVVGLWLPAEPLASATWQIWLPALLLSLACGMALVYYSPVFRGYNATFLLAAALGARAIQFPVDNTGAALISFGIYELTLLLTAFFLFIAIQIRYRLHLWPNYETIEIPDRFLWIGGALTLFCALLYVIVGWPAYSRTGLDRYFIPAACLYVCAAQWTLGASILSRRHSLTLARQKETVQATFLRTLAIVALSLAALLYAGLTFPGPGLQRLTRARGASGELMLLTGMLLDRDHDGNSLWPGADPDDTDPCVRADIGALCDDAHRADDDLAITATGRNAVLLTWVNTERGARMPTATTGIPLYFATNRPVRSIRAMFQGTDGMGDYAGIRPGDFGFLPRLARAGYRTLCAGSDGGRGYFRAGSRSRLDAGCQVFQPLDPGITQAGSGPEKASATPSSSSHDINDTIRAGLRLLDRYGENSANFLWIHHAAASDETPPRSELLQRLQQKGELIVIQLYPDDVFGQAFIYTRQSSSPMVEYPEPGPLLAYALGFSQSPPPTAKDRVAVLYDQPLESSWWLRAVRRLGSRYPSFPVYTLRLDEAGQPLVFDGLTGSLTRPPRQSPQSRPL